MRECYVIEIDGFTEYARGLELQQKAFDLVRDKDLAGIILLLQHKPVFTIGSSGGMENLLVPKENLKELGIEIYETRRGGNITYHGPGQLVGYPILNLNKFKKDVHWHLRQLEEVIIQTLETYDIVAGRKPRYTGVWVGDKKITAIGVSVKRWITMHGFAFNLCVDKDHFELIHPCGITDFGITSLNDFIETIDYRDILNRIKKQFAEVFNMEAVENSIKLLEG